MRSAGLLTAFTQGLLAYKGASHPPSRTHHFQDALSRTIRGRHSDLVIDRLIDVHYPLLPCMTICYSVSIEHIITGKCGFLFLLMLTILRLLCRCYV